VVSGNILAMKNSLVSDLTTVCDKTAGGRPFQIAFAHSHGAHTHEFILRAEQLRTFEQLDWHKVHGNPKAGK
jgi:hypothetical protein